MNNLKIENLSRSIDVGGGAERISERLGAGKATGGGSPESGTTFSDLLRQSVDKVNEHQHDADTAIKELVAGRSKNVHETMLAVERADASLKLMMQVRNKVLDAYREIMRMQV